MSNGGTQKMGNTDIPFGKDSSDYCGPASKERLSDSMNGGPSDLSRTLSGAEATLRQGKK